MNQQKIGFFLRNLRKESGMTQEQLAEILGVNNRTISRWENANTMPDFDMLIELAKYYDVSIEELLNGERTAINMEKQTEKTLYDIAEYTNNEKERLMQKLHFFSWIGAICWIVSLGLEALGLADLGITAHIASSAMGVAFGTAVIAVLYTGKYIHKVQAFKKSLNKNNANR